MTVEQQEWIRKELGPSIDALEIALNGLSPANPDTIQSVRRVLQMLHGAGRAVGLTEIANAAALAYNATNLEIRNRVAGLIQMLREQARKVQGTHSSVLLIGSDRCLADLETRLRASGRDTILVTSATEAERILRERETVFIVVDLFLPDLDVRQFVASLRCRPLTAAIPILVVSSRASDSEAGLADLLPDVDGFFGKPLDTQQIFEAMEQRLRRAHERVRAAHRDPVTGLLNRAAFGEHFERAMASHHETKEPIAIAVMKIDRFQQLSEQHGAETGEKMLRHFGSVLARHFRTTDVVARWSGCEFMALFPGEDSQGATRAMARIREALGREPFPFPDGKAEALKLYAGISMLPDQANIASALSQAGQFMSQAQAEGGDKVVSTPPQTKRKDRVVLITASETTAKVLSHLFGKEGFDVQIFQRMDEATAKFLEGSKCHLLVVDDLGRDISDLLFIRNIRTIPRQSRTPILLLTANAETAARAPELGANDHVAKPFDLLSLMKTSRRLLTRGISDDRTGEGPESLLIISNDLHSLIILGTALQKQTGFAVLLARGGQDGVNQLGKRRPAATLIDLKPRSRDWTQVMEALVVLRPAPAIVVAVDAEDYQMVRGVKSPQIKGILTKPLQPLSLAGQVQDASGIVPAGASGRRDTADMLKAEMDRVMRLQPDGQDG